MRHAVDHRTTREQPDGSLAAPQIEARLVLGRTGEDTLEHRTARRHRPQPVVDLPRRAISDEGRHRREHVEAGPASGYQRLIDVRQLALDEDAKARLDEVGLVELWDAPPLPAGEHVLTDGWRFLRVALDHRHLEPCARQQHGRREPAGAAAYYDHIRHRAALSG
jgi:hypothetical protein